MPEASMVNAVDVYVFETAGELLTDVIDEVRIDLLVQKVINLQNPVVDDQAIL